jgi:hypothetical protein
MLTGFTYLQMSRQLHSSSRSRGNTEPPSSPPQPTSAELLQMLVESQHALDESVRNHVHQEPEPVQYSNYKDFLDIEPPIFREAEEPLQADEWLNTIEQKFHVLKVADDMKIEYASQQLQGPVGIWWCHHRNTLLENMEVVWDQFKEAFRGHYIPSGLMAIKHIEFMKLTQGDKSIIEHLHAFINLSRYAPEFVNTEVKKIASFKRGLCPKLMKAMHNSKCATFNEFVSDTILQENCNVVYATSKSHEKSYESNAPTSNTLVVIAP